MHINTLRKTVAAFLLSAASIFAMDMAVFPPNTTNLSTQQGDAIGEVMAAQYSKVSKKAVTGPNQSRTYLSAQNNDFTAAAKAMGISEYIFLNAISLQNKIILEAILYNQNGSEQYRSQMTASSMDDMIEVTDRLSRSLLYRLPSEETRDLDNITETETEEPNRLSMEKVSGFKCGFGPGIFDRENIYPMATIGYNLKVESKKFFLEFGASALIPTDWESEDVYGGAVLEMGASYYLRSNPYVSPYIGAGISPRILFSPGCIGVAPYAQFGVMFMRLAKTRLYTDLRISQNVAPVTFTDYQYDYATGLDHDSKRTYYPTELMLEVGIGW